jgi:pimeloyl-ACP methyl ester carboxylesterase
LCERVHTLTKNWQLIAVELQGNGPTADIDHLLTFEQMGDDVAAPLKHLQIEQDDFFGEGFGGVVAMAIAVCHPELVGRVATYASPFSKFEDAYPRDFMGQWTMSTPVPRSPTICEVEPAALRVARERTQSLHGLASE